MTDWKICQDSFEAYDRSEAARQDINVYLKEIDSVKELYTQEFHLEGAILDVGGHIGKLRHFLDMEKCDYTCIDPYAAFDTITPVMRQAYPCLNKPCNFRLGTAEQLPFKDKTFDWIHMRSVIDHFEMPQRALAEAHRVAKPQGQLLIGLAIEEKIPMTPRRWIRERLFPDNHVTRFTEEELYRAIHCTGWMPVKTVWQKPPFDYCLYIQARKWLK